MSSSAAGPEPEKDRVTVPSIPKPQGTVSQQQPQNQGRISDVSDIGNLIGDGSFSDADDSNSWMQKIDVTGFKELTVVPDAGTCQLTTTDLPSGRQYTLLTTVDKKLDLEPAPQPTFPHPPSLTLLAPAPLTTCSSVTSSFPSPCPSSLSSDYNSLSSPPTKRGKPSSNFDYNIDGGLIMSRDISSSSDRHHPKPTYSYSCLIALALKNSKTGRLTVSEIYNFMCQNFPYFRTAPAGWKNSVRHNLSLNKCFEKIDIDVPAGQGRKACLWTLNPNRRHKMEQEILKWREKDPTGVRDSLANPDELELIETGMKGMPGESSVGSLTLNRLPDVVTHTQQAFLTDSGLQGLCSLNKFAPFYGSNPMLRCTSFPPGAPIHPFLPTSTSFYSNPPPPHMITGGLHPSTPPKHQLIGGLYHNMPNSGPLQTNFLETSPIPIGQSSPVIPVNSRRPQFRFDQQPPFVHCETIPDNNNSLLHSALWESPCKRLPIPVTTLQSL